ncbi:MAG: LytTR family DNA-binding domain-containing protein [Bacteroidota bacterium]
MMKKVIIVDDESAARKLIKEYLQDYPDLVLLGEANNGVDAVKIIQKFQPDLLFLDIQMPGLTGFEVLTRLDVIPQVIFSTAYDQYALQAFEVHAVDYLLKPYTKERFQEAVSRVLNQDNTAIGPLTESLYQEKSSYPEKILVPSGRKLVSIDVQEIIRIEADGDYSRLVLPQNTYLSSYGISRLEEKLNPDTFLRVHRSSIVNIHFIESVEKYPSSYDLILENKDVVRVSRSYMERIKNLMF